MHTFVIANKISKNIQNFTAMQKRSFINRVYNKVAKTGATSKVYRDTDWRGINFLLQDIESAFTGTQQMTLVRSDYEGVMGECGHRKVYRYQITDEVNDITVDVQIIASFCGTMADPMGAYDLTMLLN